MSTVADRPYTRVAAALHWTIAILIITNLAVAWWMEGLEEPYRTLVVRLHQSSGITVLILTVIRIGWRLTHRPPPLDVRLTPAERSAASVAHLAFYLAMLALPLSGWALISANPPRYEKVSAGSPPATPKRPKYIMLWGVLPLYPIAAIQSIAAEPGGIARQRVLHHRIVRAHGVMGYGLLALLVLHVAGALKHEFVDGHQQLSRMRLRRPRPKTSPDPR